MELIRPVRHSVAAVVLAATAACGGTGGGGRQVDVTAREYVFEGLPSTLQAGDAIFSFENKGSEVHELQLFRLNEDVGSISELLDKSQDEARDKMTSVGMAIADPGRKESFDAELQAGRYAAVCLIPAGTFPDEERSVHDVQDMEDMVFDPNADTHMRRGMFAELDVAP